MVNKFMVFFIIILIIYLIIRYCSNVKKNNKESFLNYSKINGIDKIVWINLDRSKKRRNHMSNLLNNLNVRNQRVAAIDGKNIDTQKIIKGMQCFQKMENVHIACTLSHIKAIQSLRNVNGEYFMVCEDDILLDNLKYFKKDLKTIISEAPKDFEVLMIYKTWPKDLKKTYVNWKEYYREYRPVFSNKIRRKGWIAGTCCYIITRKAVKKLSNYVRYKNDRNFSFNRKLYNKFDLADVYIYLLFKTYVYRYNFIDIRVEETTIGGKKYLENHSKCSIAQKKIIMRNLNQI